MQIYENEDYFIPVIWEGNGIHQSPDYSSRYGEYSVDALPSAAFNGDVFDVGGGTGVLSRYQSIYNNLVNTPSPMEIDIQLGSSSGQLDVTADVLMTETIPSNDYRIIYMLTYFYNSSYNSTVVRYAEEDFMLTTNGASGQFVHSFVLDSSWNITNLKAIILVQNVNATGTFVVPSNPNPYIFNKHPILQGAITDFTGLLPMLSSNVTEGPAYLGVQFTNNSFPTSGIDSWSWDFDGDGTYDSTEENPFHLYTEPGVYDVTLKIEVGGEFAEITVADYITVTDGSSVSGNLSGIWFAENTYTITDDAHITEGDQLIVSEGTKINIENGAQLTVNGLLIADASSARNEPIVFTSESSWHGIRFFNTLENNVLNNCEISNASVSAIRIEGNSKVDIRGCRIFDNNSTSLGAALEIIGSDNILISQNIIANNFSIDNAGAIGCTASSPEIKNNLIVNNTGKWGAFYFQNESNPIMTNNTIANNKSTNYISNSPTPYLFFLLNSIPVITNSIIIDNGEIYFPQSTPEITYSCITGNFTGEGNIDENPFFASPTAGDGAGYNGLAADWSLQTGSLCINNGDPDAMFNDIDGSRNDMGAFGGPTPYELETTNSDDNTVNVIAINSISVYPNPFNPSANISLSINENDLQHPISVKIFNIKGQLVKTIVNNEVVQNTNLIWNGKDDHGNSTSSGMYFVKMKTATSEVSKKMLLIK